MVSTIKVLLVGRLLTKIPTPGEVPIQGIELSVASTLDILLRVHFISGFIKKKIRKGLGLNNTTMVLTGAAPTPPGTDRMVSPHWYKDTGGICND